METGTPSFDSRQGIFFFFASVIRLVLKSPRPPTGVFTCEESGRRIKTTVFSCKLVIFLYRVAFK